MSVLHMPFVGSAQDTVLTGVAIFTLLASIGGAAYAFWRIHEIPKHHAQKTNHQQMALVSILTFIGLFIHWVWVVAIVVAYFDAPSALRSVRNIWKESPVSPEKEDEVC